METEMSNLGKRLNAQFFVECAACFLFVLTLLFQ